MGVRYRSDMFHRCRLLGHASSGSHRRCAGWDDKRSRLVRYAAHAGGVRCGDGESPADILRQRQRRERDADAVCGALRDFGLHCRRPRGWAGAHGLRVDGVGFRLVALVPVGYGQWWVVACGGDCWRTSRDPDRDFVVRRASPGTLRWVGSRAGPRLAEYACRGRP